MTELVIGGLLVGLVGAAVGTTAGDQWVVPGFVIAVTFYLIVWTG